MKNTSTWFTETEHYTRQHTVNYTDNTRTVFESWNDIPKEAYSGAMNCSRIGPISFVRDLQVADIPMEEEEKSSSSPDDLNTAQTTETPSLPADEVIHVDSTGMMAHAIRFLFQKRRRDPAGEIEAQFLEAFFEAARHPPETDVSSVDADSGLPLLESILEPQDLKRWHDHNYELSERQYTEEEWLWLNMHVAQEGHTDKMLFMVPFNLMSPEQRQAMVQKHKSFTTMWESMPSEELCIQWETEKSGRSGRTNTTGGTHSPTKSVPETDKAQPTTQTPETTKPVKTARTFKSAETMNDGRTIIIDMTDTLSETFREAFKTPENEESKDSSLPPPPFDAPWPHIQSLLRLAPKDYWTSRPDYVMNVIQFHGMDAVEMLLKYHIPMTETQLLLAAMNCRSASGWKRYLKRFMVDGGLPSSATERPRPKVRPEFLALSLPTVAKLVARCARSLTRHPLFPYTCHPQFLKLLVLELKPQHEELAEILAPVTVEAWSAQQQRGFVQLILEQAPVHTELAAFLAVSPRMQRAWLTTPPDSVFESKPIFPSWLQNLLHFIMERHGVVNVKNLFATRWDTPSIQWPSPLEKDTPEDCDFRWKAFQQFFTETLRSSNPAWNPAVAFEDLMTKFCAPELPRFEQELVHTQMERAVKGTGFDVTLLTRVHVSWFKDMKWCNFPRGVVFKMLQHLTTSMSVSQFLKQAWASICSNMLTSIALPECSDRESQTTMEDDSDDSDSE